MFNLGRLILYYEYLTLIAWPHRLASSMHQRVIEDFQCQLYRTCGIRSLVLTAYEGEEHDLRVGMCIDCIFRLSAS
jgi:hypothetical protein